MAITKEQFDTFESGTPAVLKGFNQWVVWRYEMRNGDMTKVPLNPANGNGAKSNDPATWGSYNDVVNTVHAHHERIDGIGFMLSPEDPFVFIDLDNPYARKANGALKYEDDDRDELAAMGMKIISEFDSYTELSPSGQGYHIIVKCDNKAEIFKHGGGRRKNVEIYAEGRFMTMTGNVRQGKGEIWGRRELVSVLYKQVKIKQHGIERAFDPSLEQTLNDDDIVKRGYNASNGEKFRALFEGKWQDLNIGDGSQSVADQALLNMLVFYSGNREQVKRIFRASGMYRPDKKSTKNGREYLDFSIDKAFDMTPDMVDISALTEQWLAIQAGQSAPQPEAEPQFEQPSFTESHDMPNKPLLGADVEPMPEAEGIRKPPGLIGDIADYIYASAPRPVPEIALAGAISLMAGMCGRAYNISHTGLNQYIVLLAGTGTGKEAAASGISRLISALSGRIEGAQTFIGPSKFSSAPALLKHLSDTSQSFVSVFGEFGMYMSQMSGDKASTYMIELRRAFLDLFGKSGKGQTLQPSVYSDHAKNSKAIPSPAFSFLGETTPERFYQNLSEDLISEGFLPRMCVIQYNGVRVPLNEGHAEVQIPQTLLQRLAALTAQVQMLNAKTTPHDVIMTDEAQELARAFNQQCDAAINAPDADQVTKELWNRAHLKALKMAGLVAVGIDQFRPTVTNEIMQWGIDVAIRDCETIVSKFERGEVGNGVSESAQERKLMDAFKWWNTHTVEQLGKHGERYAKARSMHILPYRVISQKLSATATFKNDRRGANAALKATLDALIKQGLVAKPGPNDASIAGVPEGDCYVALRPDQFMGV